MKLKSIRIKDYRSIVDQTIEFNENCLGLIGLNESGKSNVLNALRILQENYAFTNNDKSKITGEWPSLECIFTLDEEDIALIEAHLVEFLDTMKTITSRGYELPENQTIRKVSKVANDSGVFGVDTFYYYSPKFSFDFQILKLTNPTFPAGSSIAINGAVVPLDQILYIQKDLIPAELSAYFEEYSLEHFEEDFDSWLPKAFPKLSPEVIFWEYNDKYLVPSEITYEKFLEGDKPYENSTPLYNIFWLTHSLGIRSLTDLKIKIALWKTDSSEGRKDGELITDRINAYIKNIWADYDQQLSVTLEQSKITIHINDPASAEKNFYAMEARSQGFKTFISFLLTIAAEAETEVIDNYILLLDEPETHLHPSGVRYMKEELLKLSQSGNYIIYSTHSIFMIDRGMLPRHIKVEKNSEITKLIKIQRNNFIQEAVLYEAMGTRIDEFSFGARNVIVEGDLDLLLFEYFISFYNDEIKPGIKDAHIYNGGGTTSITNFLKSKILPYSSTWIIILDNDLPARNLATFVKEQFNKHAHLKVSTHHYSSFNNFELEDILPRHIIKLAFEKTIQILGLPNPYNIDLANESKIVSELTNEFLNRPATTKEAKSKFEETIKGETTKIVNEILIEINGLADTPTKLAKFIEKFPAYNEAMEKIVLKPVAKVAAS